MKTAARLLAGRAVDRAWSGDDGDLRAASGVVRAVVIGALIWSVLLIVALA